jgi:cytosine/adenosine deaminase-related metal-dependent hydrolase
LQSGRAPLEALRSAGVPFGIGLDGMAFDDDEDMLREIRLVWHMLGRGHGMRPLLEPSELFDAAVLAGRRTIVGDDGGGRIEPGAPADLLSLDMAEMTRDCVPEEVDVVGMLLTRAASRHVRDVVVAGRRVVESGACVTVDIPAAERELRNQARRSWAANPPDFERISRLKEKVAVFYEREGQVPK